MHKPPPSQILTPFGCWLAKQKIVYADAAKALGTTRSYIHALATGRATPALRLAGEIEIWTKKAVPMQSWIKVLENF